MPQKPHTHNLRQPSISMLESWPFPRSEKKNGISIEEALNGSNGCLKRAYKVKNILRETEASLEIIWNLH